MSNIHLFLSLAGFMTAIFAWFRFDINKRFDGMSKRIDDVNKRIDDQNVMMNQRFDGMGQRAEEPAPRRREKVG